MAKINIARMGRAFEERAKNALIKNHYVLVDKNKWVANYAPDKDYASKREFDLVMFHTLEKQFYVVECKSHVSKDKLVGYEQARKFNYVADHYGASRARKLIITDTDLSPKAKDYVARNNIAYINGKQLAEMEKRFVNPLVPALSWIVQKGLEGIIASFR